MWNGWISSLWCQLREAPPLFNRIIYLKESKLLYMIKTHGLTHISLKVADMDKSVQYYKDVFGVVEYYRDEQNVQVKGPLRVREVLLLSLNILLLISVYQYNPQVT